MLQREDSEEDILQREKAMVLDDLEEDQGKIGDQYTCDREPRWLDGGCPRVYHKCEQNNFVNCHHIETVPYLENVWYN